MTGKWLAAAAVVMLAQASGARAEVADMRMATQFGIGAMPMILMQRNHLLEQQLGAAGLKNVKVSWHQFPGGAPMNDGLLSGSLDIVSGGTTVFLTLWAKARGTPSAVRSVGALSALPLWFLTRNPDVKRLEDLSDKDKIAVTTVKVSVHAMLLQMAAEKIWGSANSNRFDRLTVTMPHANAAAAMMSGSTEINNHFTAPPYQNMEIKASGVRRITTAQDILGARSSYMVAYATEKFRADNPRAYGAFVAALRQSLDIINKDPRGAASDYLDVAKDPISLDELTELVTDPGSKFAMTPDHVTAFADFMLKQGLTKTRPESWKDLFFPEVHDQPGS
jgi:NitT/TauT family transport system substrate-binding protein